MKEELIRVDNGHFLSEGSDYQFDIFIARGECIGIYVDEHLTSGTAYLDIFKGYSSMAGGAAFCCGDRVGSWIKTGLIPRSLLRRIFYSRSPGLWDDSRRSRQCSGCMRRKPYKWPSRWA